MKVTTTNKDKKIINPPSRKPSNKIIGKGKNIVKIADQPPVKLIRMLKDKTTKTTYFNDKRVMDRHTKNKKLDMI